MNYNSELKVFKEWEITKKVVYNLVLSMFITLVLLVITINIFGLRLDEVLSDSMYPVFSDQDIVVIKPQDDYEIGDIIEYKKGNTLVTHRIVAYDETTGLYTTRGEHYGAADDVSISKSQINGKVIAVWFNGRQIYHIVKENYLLIIALVFGAWVVSSTLSSELERRSHNILKAD